MWRKEKKRERNNHGFPAAVVFGPLNRHYGNKNRKRKSSSVNSVDLDITQSAFSSTAEQAKKRKHYENTAAAVSPAGFITIAESRAPHGRPPPVTFYSCGTRSP
ncbi:hypothetical protein AAFF_G00385950 [Aldrovandia affinis]|uniref:Uncharacterized protein n=1 Tax=Aldrovandia affinis TaxID=143900 RepID=A0AAD7SEY8_9TELE|nr:hypothetical protein AAFF_G00385950 [Aldrovandia affinis]